VSVRPGVVGGGRLVAAALVIAGAAVLPSRAMAIESIQRASAVVRPSVSGTKARPRAVSLTVRGYFDDISADLSREVQFATVRGDIFFPKEGLTNNRLFPSCDPAVVFQDERECPAGSLVGTGTARGVGLGLDEIVTLQVFNRPQGRGDVVLVVGDSPLIIRDIVVADLKVLTKDPKYRYQLSFTVPKDLQSPAPGVIAAVKDLTVTVPVQYLRRGGSYVRRRGQRIPYIATTGCAAGRWTGKYVAQYTTSFDSAIESTQTVEVSVPCTQGR
jgi:hypothetical protein